MMTAQPLEHWPKWRDSLVYHLRMKEIPGDRIGDILLEVDTHLQESGETPEVAFGDAKSYARTRVESMPAKVTDDSSVLTIAALAFVGSALYVDGAWSLGDRTDAFFGLNPWIAFVLGAAVIFIGLWRLPMDLVRHPITNTPLLGGSGTGKVVIGAILVATGAVFLTLGRLLA